MRFYQVEFYPTDILKFSMFDSNFFAKVGLVNGLGSDAEKAYQPFSKQTTVHLNIGVLWQGE